MNILDWTVKKTVKKYNVKINDEIVVIFTFFWSYGTLGSKLWEQGCTQSGARRREGCRIWHYLINRFFQTVDAVFPKGSLFSLLAHLSQRLTK